MILGYLAYAIVFTFGLLIGCALGAHKIETLQQQLHLARKQLMPTETPMPGDW